MDELEAVEEALRDVADVHPRVGANVSRRRWSSSSPDA